MEQPIAIGMIVVLGGIHRSLPFGFASEKGMLYLVIAIAIVMFILFILFGYR